MNTKTTSRNTQAKSSILLALSEAKCALSHAQLNEKLLGVCDRVTIYRVLDRLISEKKVHRIADIDGSIKYASCHECNHPKTDLHTHVHFSCQKCKTLICLDQIEPKVILPDGFEIKETNFTISGFCNQCNV
jgi:Fur family ferric uptake transcriptional regulator